MERHRNYSLQVIPTAFSHLGSSGNRSGGSFNDLRRFIGLLDLFLLGLGRRGSGIGGRVLEGSDGRRPFNLRGSLVNLGGGVDILAALRLEKLVDASRQTTGNPARGPGDLLLLIFLLLLFLLLLGLRRGGLRDGGLRLCRSGGFSLLDRFRGRSGLNNRLRSRLLGLGLGRSGLLRRGGILGGGSGRLG